MTLEEEKLKIDHAHKLEIRRLWLDKILFAALIALAGYIGNIVLESYKSDLAKTQFLLERRLDALANLRDSYDKLGKDAYAEVYVAGSANADAYAKDVLAYFNAINRSAFLFSEGANREFAHYGWVHQAIATRELKLAHEHWGFVVDLAQAFDDVTRRALTVEVLGTSPQDNFKGFKIQIWRQEDMIKKGGIAFFKTNFEKWKSERKPQ